MSFSISSSALAADPEADSTASSISLNSVTWTAQVPDPAAAKIVLNPDCAFETVQLEALGNTDMWGQRNGAPMMTTPSPEGNFSFETKLTVGDIKTNSVAGITVFDGSLTNVPRFTLGLDHWNGTQKVKFQGLPPQGNEPGIEIPVPGVCTVWLKLEVYKTKFTNRPQDYYVASYKLEKDAPWKLVTRFSESPANSCCSLFLKTSGPVTAVFSQTAFETLSKDKYAYEPPKVADPVALKRIFGQKKLLFVSRLQYRGDHHNTATMFQTGEINAGSFVGGSALKYIDFAQDGKIITLLDCPQGVIRDPEVSWDGTKIIFSMRNNREDDYHIYELTMADQKVRQITFGSGLSDIDPAYLPDGRIVFSSTREPKYCMCNRHIMCNLYTMQPDGSDMVQIGHSTLFEGHSSILSDGRIVYDRWEYVDRNFGDAQGLWVANPDGTSHLLYYGNNTGAPGAFLEARELPGSKMALCTLSSCHDRPWGAIALLDRTQGIEGQDGIVRTWPEDAIDKVNINGSYDAFTRQNPKYEDPFPMSQTQFLCSRQIIDRDGKACQGEKTGIVLLDMDGSEMDIYSEPAESPRGCYDPMIIESRTLPEVIEDRTDLTKKSGTFYVADVYIGTGMEAIPRGTVKWLRVVESPEKRFWSHTDWQGSGTQAPGMAWDDFNNKRILGTVPVEEDGSANFELPSDTYVYFQILDEQGRMIQSMRSGTIVRPGENQGCIGCHEDRLNAVAPRRTAKALLRPASKLQPWYGQPRTFSFTAEVQPVFNKNCLECHDRGKDGAKKICLAPDLNLAFNNSYFELRKNQNYVRVIGAGPAPVQNPRTWGSFVSPLANVVLNGHGDPERDKHLNLSQEDKNRVITWLDINAPYYSEYSTPYYDGIYGRAPINNQQLTRLSELTGISLNQQHNANSVWFDRPEMSSCLSKLTPGSADYKEALAIIVAGAERMKANPRTDMPECRLAPNEVPVQQKYDQRLADEQASVKQAAQNQNTN